MVDLSIENGRLVAAVKGLDRIWAFKQRVVVALANVVGVRADAGVARGWWKGLRAPGTHIPGVIIAGTFYQDGKRIFWDVHDPERAIVVTLASERYDELVVEVEDPAAAVAMIESATER